MNQDPRSPKLLTTVATDAEAAALLTALEANGIIANRTGGFTAGFRAEAPGGIQIWVASEDVEQAMVAYAEIQSNSEPINWDEVDVGSADEGE